MKLLFLPCVMLAITSPALAAQDEAPAQAQGNVELYRSARLAAGTPVELEMAQTVTTRGRTWKKGDAFELSVSEPVTIGEYVVIPQGALAFGHVSEVTGPGVFGKSGKIEVQIDHLVLGGRKLKLTGLHRSEGKGALTSVGSFAAAGPLAVFIQGDEGTIAQGSPVTAYLADGLGVILPYAQNDDAAGTSHPTMVRARRINVSEAFSGDGKPWAIEHGVSASARRITVAEAFKPELDAIRKQP